MSKRIACGIILISIFILSSIFTIMPVNNQSNKYITENSNKILTNSLINVSHPADFEIVAGDTTNHTISWTLTETDLKDYLGAYSFIDDLDGSVPSGWTRPYNDSGTSGKVISEKASHRKVVELYDNNLVGYTILRNIFPSQENGTVEWWFYGTATGPKSSLQFSIYRPAYGGASLYFNTSGSELKYYDVSFHKICDLPNNQWHHCRVQFNCTDDRFDMWIDGIKKITGAQIDNLTTNINMLDLYTGYASTGGFYTYIDAIDYSWAPGYYLNRNMNYISDNLTYAIFDDGAQKTIEQTWSNQIVVNYNVTRDSLGIGIHNISLVFNDQNGNWFHDDVEITVADSESPKILEIIQNPITPAYQEPVTITAHVTDDNQVQTVLVEATEGDYNLTGSKEYSGIYSFSNDPNGANPNGWTTTEIGGSVQVISSKNGHNKIVEVFDNSATTEIKMKNTFGVQSKGTIEFWIWTTGGSNAEDAFSWYLNDDSTYVGILCLNLPNTRCLGYYHGVSWEYLGDISPDTWVHIRLAFEATTSGYEGLNQYELKVWVNGILSANHLPFWNSVPHINGFSFGTAATQTKNNWYGYVDAVDYSWAPGYYLNRNMISTQFVNYSMSLLSGNQQDGNWIYTFNNYPTNKSVLYRIFAQDTVGNWNVSGYYNFGYFDTLGPNILSVTQTPSAPTYLDIMNVTVHVADATQVQTVSIQSNHTGTFSTYPMSLISGTSQDGIWRYTFNNYPTNKSILYRIFTQDTVGNSNVSGYHIFGYFDTLGPNILSVTQTPSAPTYLDIMNVTVHITDATQVQTVSIQSNHTGAFSTYSMSLISGTSQDGIWKFSFGTYPLNAIIIYGISTEDVLGNSNSSLQCSFGVFDLINPTISTVVQNPAVLTKWESVKVIVHVHENIALGSVMFNSNYTGNWVDYPMTLLNGSLQDGFWEYIITSYPYNKSIWYRISAIDVTGRTTTIDYLQFGIFPIVSTYITPDIEYEVDVGMAGDRRTDITFTLQNTGNTHLVNVNFTIELPVGWTAQALGPSVTQLGPGESATLTFKVIVPKDIGEFQEFVVIKVDARIAELEIDWPTQTIEVAVVGVKVWDLFIWMVIIVGSASAAVTTTYVYIHKRTSTNKASKAIPKGKTLLNLKAAISADFPGPFGLLSIELMERINNIRGITDEEKQFLIEDVAQLDEDQAKKWIDAFEKTLMQ